MSTAATAIVIDGLSADENESNDNDSQQNNHPCTSTRAKRTATGMPKADDDDDDRSSSSRAKRSRDEGAAKPEEESFEEESAMCLDTLSSQPWGRAKSTKCILNSLNGSISYYRKFKISTSQMVGAGNGGRLVPTPSNNV